MHLKESTVRRNLCICPAASPIPTPYLLLGDIVTSSDCEFQMIKLWNCENIEKCFFSSSISISMVASWKLPGRLGEGEREGGYRQKWEQGSGTSMHSTGCSVFNIFSELCIQQYKAHGLYISSLHCNAERCEDQGHQYRPGRVRCGYILLDLVRSGYILLDVVRFG